MNTFVVQLPEYEGPLDFLLSIVRNNDLSIANLPLAPITSQYLAYIDQATALDINLSMEWIEMAARLILWKSASLLPTDPALPDPTLALAQDLSRELKQLSDRQLAQATDFLSDLGSHSARSHAHHPTHPEATQRDATPEPDPASLWTVRRKAQILRDIFRARRMAENIIYEPEEETASVGMMASWIRGRLQQLQESQWIDIHPWFEEIAVLQGKISLFLALLELARTESIRLEQRNGVLGLLRLHPPSGC